MLLYRNAALPILLGYKITDNEGQGMWNAWEGSKILIYHISVLKSEGKIPYAAAAEC